MYGSQEYGVNLYGQDLSIQDIVINAIKPNLIKYIALFLREVSEFKVWNDSCGYELGLLKYKLDDILKQFFIDTATWGIPCWEQQYGIQIDINKTYEDRREIIKAKMRGTGTTTKQMIKNAAEAFSNGECEVIEHPENYSFTVKFIGIKGIPHNMQAFKDMLEIIKPAHLACDFNYIYTVWSFLENKKLIWSEAKANTWDKLKNYDD